MPAMVLVVEDEAKIRELLRSYLEREGFDVVSTGSGAEAIGLAQSACPDLVVLDLRLPDVPGEVVVAEVRRFSAVPVLMLTAKSAEEDRIRGLELGADDYDEAVQPPRGRAPGPGHPPAGRTRGDERAVGVLRRG